MTSPRGKKRGAMQRWEDLVRKVFGGPQVGPYPSVGAYDPLPDAASSGTVSTKVAPPPGVV
jgi:hypothetical protein